ncbi:hypothetical protein CMI47_03285 [Candidatus Pacearchaeota archaeon]|nr:hypothetical protein [Candidatus Pacearchaeota archaeon]|tara:strand:+ start:306 stop:1145 length:840 start_codon:yes stop_codon:yes gene_type:complete
MKKSEITFLISIQNKMDCLNNTFSSIRGQIIKQGFNLCIVDDRSTKSSLPIIKNYFNDDDYIYKKIDLLGKFKRGHGFELGYRNFLDIIPKETKIVILQSCDIIMGDNKLLDRLVSVIKDAGSKGGYKSAISVPKNLNNYQVSKDLYKSKNLYNSLVAPKDLSLWGHKQSTSYPFLSAMLASDFRKALDARLWGSDGICDIIVRDTLKRLKVPTIVVDGTAVHQRHASAMHECTSISSANNNANGCTHPCKPRRNAIAKGSKFPIYRGTYNLKTRKWVK